MKETDRGSGGNDDGVDEEDVVEGAEAQADAHHGEDE